MHTCPDCLPIPKLARRWRVSNQLVLDFVQANILATHQHGARTCVTHDSVLDVEWRVAVAKASHEDQAA